MKFPLLGSGINQETRKQDNFMKKFILIFFLFISLTSYAKEEVLESCIYHNFTVLDRDNNLIEDIPSSNGDPQGLFLLADIDGTKFISVTSGKDSLLDLQVYLSKEVEENGIRTEIYGGAVDFENQKVPLQVFVFYTKSDTPDDVVIDIYNSPTLIRLSGLVKIRH